MTLIRDRYAEQGIFGTLRAEGISFQTLERAYPIPGGFRPKLPTGEYQCVRGMHRLTRGEPFETFEIIGVKGHWGILFHVGNYNQDSSGCVLLGLRREGNAITGSRLAFFDFMNYLKGVDQFTLTVVGG